MAAVGADAVASRSPVCAWGSSRTHERVDSQAAETIQIDESLRSEGAPSVEFEDVKQHGVNKTSEAVHAEWEVLMREAGLNYREDWDQSQTLSPGGLVRDRSCGLRAADRFNGTHGPNGLKTLSLSSAALEAAKGWSGSLDGTQSAESAIHGRNCTWVRGESIGVGSMGSVFKGLDQRTGQLLAVKEVRIDEGQSTDVKLLQALENEISIIKELRHPRIVSFFGYDYIESRLYVYLEYMAGGSLAQVIDDFGALDESLAASYTRDIVEGLEYLHSREPPVLHRDIKGANILVGLDCRVKLTDFGCSKRTEDAAMATLCGSVPWMAPEVILQRPSRTSADIWSLGCVVIEMTSGKQPWGGFDNHMAAMFRIGVSKDEIPIPDCMSPLGQDFVRQCVSRDPETRATAKDLLNHEFACELLED